MKNFSIIGLIPAIIYLFPIFFFSILLFREGAIHHGTGIYFLPPFVLTFPLSWIAFAITDKFGNGTSFYPSMAILIVSAFINAFLIYWAVSKIEKIIRKN